MHVDLATIHLDKGSHPDDGRGCLLEWTARFAGEPVTDHPVCTSPVLAAFGIAWNDTLDDETRQRLVPYIPRLVGTAGDPKADQVRAWMATDWLIRTVTPTWLRKAGLSLEVIAFFSLATLAYSAKFLWAPVVDRTRVPWKSNRTRTSRKPASAMTRRKRVLSSL